MKQLDSQVQSFSLPPPPQLPENNSPKKQRLSALYDVPLQGVLFLGRLLPAHRMQTVAKHLRLIRQILTQIIQFMPTQPEQLYHLREIHSQTEWN